MKKALWRWEWEDGGWNQCYAYTRDEALQVAKHKGVGILLVVEQSLYKVKIIDQRVESDK